MPIFGFPMSHVVRKPVLPYANSKGADQPAHPCSLISAFVVRCWIYNTPLLAISKISRLCLASVAEQACLSLRPKKSMSVYYRPTVLIFCCRP